MLVSVHSFRYGADIYNVIKNIDTVHSETLHGDNRKRPCWYLTGAMAKYCRRRQFAGVYSDLQVFSVDVWSIIKACMRNPVKTLENIGPMIMGMMYFNVALV